MTRFERVSKARDLVLRRIEREESGWVFPCRGKDLLALEVWVEEALRDVDCGG